MFKRPRLIFGLILAAFVAIRLWRLTDSCLWFDEIFSIHAAEHPWNSLFWFVAQDLIHPPLFYVFLKLWIGIGGESVLWFRLFSILFSMAAVVPFILLCREVKLKAPAALLALTFFAVNGSLIKYAQEVRMYSLLMCLSLFSFWLFARFFYRGKNIWILTIINILLVYTHYFGWLIVFSEFVVILILQRIKIRHVLIMIGIGLVAYVPWILAIVNAVRAGSAISQNIGWIERPGILSIFDLACDLIEPFYYQANSVAPSTIIIVTLPLLTAIAAATLIYVFEWKQHDERERFWMLGMILLVPIVLAFAASWIFPFSIWGSRHLIAVFPPMMILAALFLTSISDRFVRYLLIAVAFLLIGSGGYQYANTRTSPQVWCAWERLAADIPRGTPTTVFVFEDLVAYHFWFATRGSENIKIVKIEGVPGLMEDKAFFLPRGFDGVQRSGPNDLKGDRFWVAFRDIIWNEKHYPISSLAVQDYSIINRYNVSGSGMNAFLVEFQRK